MNRQKVLGLLISASLVIGGVGIPTTMVYAQTLPSSISSQITTTGVVSKSAETLTINFGGMFDMEAYLPSVNIKVIVNGQTYNETYNYGGSLTLKNVIANNTGKNTIKIEIPYFNTIILNTNSYNITVTPVETPMTFHGNTVLANAVANAIGATPSELTYYNLASYCYAEANGFGSPLDINLSGKGLTNLKGIQELKGFDINSLNLSNNNLTNLSALKGLTINNLNVSNNDIKSLDGVNKIASLNTLNANYNYISSVKQLEGLKTLTSVTLQNNMLSNSDLVNPSSLGIKGLNASGLDNNFIAGLKDQNQVEFTKSSYKAVNAPTKSDVKIISGTSKTDVTNYYSKYLTLSNKNENMTIGANNVEGKSEVIASVDQIRNSYGEAVATIDVATTKTENLTINFGGMFDMESYLPSVNVKVIVNGKSYNETYTYGGALTIKNVTVNTNGTNSIKIEIPYFNTIELNTTSNSINVSPVETVMTFDGNKTLANAVANAIGASSSELTYYNLQSYCYAEANGFGSPLNINLSGKDLTNLKGIQQLKGFDINSLNISNNNLTNLDSLEGLTINDLNVSHNDLTSVTPLTKVSGLQSLNISYNKISSTKGLSSIKGLKNIDSANN